MPVITGRAGPISTSAKPRTAEPKVIGPEGSVNFRRRQMQKLTQVNAFFAYFRETVNGRLLPASRAPFWSKGLDK